MHYPKAGNPRPKVVVTSTTASLVDFRNEEPFGEVIWFYARNMDTTNSVRVFFSAEEAANGSSTRYFTLLPSIAASSPAAVSLPLRLPDGKVWLRAVAGTPTVELLPIVTY